HPTHHGPVGRLATLADPGARMTSRYGRPPSRERARNARRRQPSRRRSAYARGALALNFGIVPALLALAFSPARPWQDTDSEAMAMTTFIVVAGVNLVLAIVIAAQAFSFGRGRSDPGSAGGSDLVTLLTLVTVVAG